jgi:hypothetical protein
VATRRDKGGRRGARHIGIHETIENRPFFRIWKINPYDENLVRNENSATLDLERSCLLPEQAAISLWTDEYPKSSSSYQTNIHDLPQNYQLNSCFPAQFI